jgi:hypothetical protein
LIRQLQQLQQTFTFSLKVEMGKKRVLVGYGVDIDAGELLERHDSTPINMRQLPVGLDRMAGKTRPATLAEVSF